MNLSEEMLMAYVDGELDAATRDQITRAMAADPDVARRVTRHQALRERLRADFDPVLAEAVPARLLAAARAGKSAPHDSNVRSFPGRKSVQRAWVQWGSLAASFVLGAIVWQFASRPSVPGPIGERHGALVAAGYLAQALSTQLTGQQDHGAPVQIGLSFRDRQGRYCRTFRLQTAGGNAGLACHENDQWTVQVLAHSEAGSAPSAQYRQAGSALPSAVLQLINDTMSGDALDATGEAQARAGGW